MPESSPHILCIETATEVCSVALYEGEQLMAERSETEGYHHAERLHPFIKACLEESGIGMDALDAVAVSIGPGSYTGLRIGLSAAQGLSFGRDIPLLGVPTLEALADACGRRHPEAKWIAPMIDARRMEVYTAVYDQEGKETLEARAMVLEKGSLSSFRTKTHSLYVCGNGCLKWKASNPRCVNWSDLLVCSARHLIRPALRRRALNQSIAPAQLKPMYIKSPNITRPQQTSE